MAGCTDESACNFDLAATDDDDSCTYAEEEYDCDGNCLSDEDGDGVCDANEVAGCTDESALNFDPLATDEDGSCVYCMLEATAVATPALCFGENTGMVIITTSGAYPSDVGQVFNLQPNDATQDNGVFENLGAGMYTVEVVDEAGCVTSIDFEITEPEALLVLVDEIAATEEGQSNGSISISVSGGTAPYDFQWTQLDGAYESTEEDIDGLGGGTYVVEVTDAHGCALMSFEITIEVLVGVDEIGTESFIVYPNPATSFVTIEWEHVVAEATLLVYDVSGRLIYSVDVPEGSTHWTLHTGDWASGAYELIWNAREERGHRRLLIGR